MKDPQSGPSIDVIQEKTVEQLEEIPVEKNTKEDLHCTLAIHTRYRSLLGQINWLQSRPQFQWCYKFSRFASKAASPTIVDVKAVNKLARQIKSQPVKLQFWPLIGPWRISGFLNASYRKMKMGLHLEAWKCFGQNHESDLRRTECLMEVFLTMKVKGLKGLCSLQPWQNSILSWNVSVHSSSSVDCGWTYQVKLHTFTRGLTQRTWWRQQEQFTYLNQRKQSTWYPCCEKTLIQGVNICLLIFQLKIVSQIVRRRHRQRQTTWSQQ